MFRTFVVFVVILFPINMVGRRSMFSESAPTPEADQQSNQQVWMNIICNSDGLHYVQFSQFYWHFEILNRKKGY